MREPGRDMLTGWLDYHRAIGVSRFFLYFDDPGDRDLDVVATARDVTARRRDAELMDELRACPQWPAMGPFAMTGRGGDRTMARQVLHVEHALDRIAREQADVDWLLHIDHDELFCTPGGDAPAHFAALTELGADHAVYLNHEAVPESIDVDDVFRDVTLFKRNPFVVERLRGPRARAAAIRRFLAYWNGKSVIRIGSGGRPSGVHRFAPTTQPLDTRVVETPCILHYPSCGFARWRAKYRQLGDFGDRWFERVPIGLPFHLDSRDQRTTSDDLARAYYRRHALLGGPAALERLRSRGLVVRIRAPSRILGASSRRYPTERPTPR
jgi:hypothetical protein